MANTYTLISSSVLTGSQASVVFSSIPSTYTDLVVLISGRTNNAAAWANTLDVQFNGDSSSLYSTTRIIGSGSTVTSGRQSNATYAYILTDPDTNGNTADTFASLELYIPNYLSTTSKPFSSFPVAENNTTAAYIEPHAGLYRNTSAITSITLFPQSDSWVSGSSFYLYGIKNS